MKKIENKVLYEKVNRRTGKEHHFFIKFTFMYHFLNNQL